MVDVALAVLIVSAITLFTIYTVLREQAYTRLEEFGREQWDRAEFYSRSLEAYQARDAEQHRKTKVVQIKPEDYFNG